MVREDALYPSFFYQSGKEVFKNAHLPADFRWMIPNQRLLIEYFHKGVFKLSQTSMTCSRAITESRLRDEPVRRTRHFHFGTQWSDATRKYSLFSIIWLRCDFR